jgi:hypothetical protein
MTGRKCSTCKHYEPAPIWRRGWCRNPLLYSAQQSHLVGEDDLDCERGMGNYWEPTDSSTVIPLLDVSDSSVPSSPATLSNPPSTPAPWVTAGGQPIYPVTGSSGYSDPPSEPPDGGRGMTPPGRERQIDYYEEDRYWTDYLRIALPVVGVILILIVFYIWTRSFFGDDDELGTNGSGTATTTLGLITSTSSASPTRGTVLGTPSVPVIVTVSVTPGPTESGGEPTEEPGTGEPTEQAPSGDIYIGAIVQVANTQGEGVNLRTEPSTSSDVAAVLLDGTELTVIDGPVEADGYVWWNVSGIAADGTEVSGWMAQDFLTLIS